MRVNITIVFDKKHMEKYPRYRFEYIIHKEIKELGKKLEIPSWKFEIGYD